MKTIITICLLATLWTPSLMANTLISDELINETLSSGDATKALTLSHTFVDQQTQKWGRTHPDVAMAYLTLGNVMAANDQYEAAIKSLETARGIINDYDYPKDAQSLYHRDMAMVLQNVGYYHWSQKNHREAERFLLSAIDHIHQVYDVGSAEEARLAYSLASLLKQSNRLEDAEPYYLRVYELQKEAGVTDVTRYVQVLQGLAAIAYRRQEYTKSKAYCDVAIALTQDNFDPSTSSYDLIHPMRILLAWIHVQSEDFETAESLLEGTIAELRKKYRPDDANITDAMMVLSDIYFEEGKYNESEAMRSEAVKLKQNRFFN